MWRSEPHGTTMDLGIDLTAATLEEFRLAQGIETSYSAMSQAEKVMLRYQYLMANTKTQQGDFQRTSLSLANAMRTLQAYAQAVQTQIGVGLASALRHVVVGLNNLMKYVLKAAQAFATFMQTIFGKYKGGASGIAMSGLGDAADYADNLSSASDSAADGLGSAADNARQLKKELSVLPFDELNQLNKDREEASSGSGSGGVGSGGVGGGLADGLLDWDDLLENSDAGKLPAWISRWGKQIKEAFEEHDFEKLGKVIADGLNKGIEKVYKLLDPEKVKEKVFPYIDAFTTTFNSLIGNLKFELMGRTVGRGINDVVAILDRAITGINWEGLGQQLASGANGLIDEVDFGEVGHLLGDKVMILWDTLYGFVTTFNWTRLGEQFANGMNGFFERVRFGKIARALVNGLNGVFESLAAFTATFDWDDFANNVSEGIITFLNEFKWRENAEKLSDFLTHLCDAISGIVDSVDWEKFGQELAIALQKLPWDKLLKTVGKVIVDVFGGILKGMGATPAGRFARAIIGGITTFKIGSKLMPFVNEICKGLTGNSATSALASAAKKLVGSGFSELGGGAVATTAGFSAMIIALLEAGEAVTQFQDSAKGGNGMLTSLGTAVDDLSNKLFTSKRITAEQSAELFALKEKAEESGMSASEFAMVIAEKMNEWGFSAGVAKQAMDELAASGHGQTDVFNEMSKALEDYDDKIVTTSGDMDMTAASVKEGMNDLQDALYKMGETATNTSIPYDYILEQFRDTAANVSSAQEAYEIAKNILGQYGVSVEDLNAILAEKYPEAAEQMTLATTESGEIVKAAEEELAQTTEATSIRRSEAIKDVSETIRDAALRNSEELRNEVKATAEAADSQAQELENWQNDVQAYRDGVLQNLQQIGEGWGTLSADQLSSLGSLNANLQESIDSQRIALENMRALNESDLDAATVQAILKQVDPSSQAMTDLIENMKGGTQEWQDFHSSIEESLSLQKELEASANEAADYFATEYAKECKPGFVTLGDDFKVEGGKIGEFMLDGVIKGVQENTDEAVEELRSTAEKMQEAWKAADDSHSPSKVYEGFARNQILGLVQGLLQNKSQAVKAIETVTKSMQEKMNELPNKIKEIGNATGSSFANGLDVGLNKVKTVSNEMSSALRTTLGAIDLYKTGTGVGISFGGGLNTGFDKANEAISNVHSILRTGLGGIDLYSSGVGVGVTFGNGVAAGISSVYIPMPHVFATFTQYDFGPFSFSLPSFGINWYRKGGLFMGGNGQVVGIGEDNRDEAVLPLEDRRAMQRIGSAIADAGGTGGSDEMVDRIAERLADIIMMRQDNEQAPIFNIEVKTENDEVLARAVERGQQRLDYRNNPTPKMAY